MGELGLYLPWFPLDVNYRPFTFALNLDVSEPGYQVTGNGAVGRQGDRWLLRSDLADKDIVVIAAPRLEEIACGPLRMVYARDDDRDAAWRVLDDSAWLLGRFTDWFRPPPQDRLTMVIAPRTKGGGYARRHIVVLTPDGLENPSVAFRWIAHELAHLWWQRADATCWEDWLNESFAEFSSVVAVRRRFPESQAAELLDVLQAKLQGLPPIVGLPREHERADVVLYAKGCVLLHRLEQAIGREAMMRLLRWMNDRAVGTTAGFLELLAEIGGRGAAAKFAAWLSE